MIRFYYYKSWLPHWIPKLNFVKDTYWFTVDSHIHGKAFMVMVDD